MFNILKANYEMTGGNCYTMWGQSDEGYFLTDIEGNPTFYKKDTDEYMKGYFYDENFDAYEWEQQNKLDITVDKESFLKAVFEYLLKANPQDTMLEVIQISYGL